MAFLGAASHLLRTALSTARPTSARWFGGKWRTKTRGGEEG
jgi:hypothetical protein